MTRTEFLEKVYALVEFHGGSITSGLRSRKRNQTVGGHPRSRHLTGFACDVVLDDEAKKEEFADDCHKAGLGTLDEGDHIHVQPRGSWGRVEA